MTRSAFEVPQLKPRVTYTAGIQNCEAIPQNSKCTARTCALTMVPLASCQLMQKGVMAGVAMGVAAGVAIGVATGVATF